MLQRVGFFHFGSNHKEPTESLQSALAQIDKDELLGSLIVLPEAFNYPADYWDEIAEPDSATMCKLERIAREFRVVFVVGLIVPDGNLLPRSSAFLIDGNQPSKLICHKLSNDGLRRYVPFTDNSSAENPIPYEDCCIGALLCNDASYDLDPAVVERRKAVMNGMEACPSPRKILCIPACDTRSARDTFSTDSRGKTLILANSYPQGCGSFVMRDRAELKSDVGSVNRICLVGWKLTKTV